MCIVMTTGYNRISTSNQSSSSTESSTTTITNAVTVDILQKYKDSQKIQFYVKTINGQRWSVQTPINVRVHLVKVLIEQNLHIFMEEQLLIVRGKQLNDFDYLNETNMKDGDTINLMPSMQSGNHKVKRDPKALFDVLLEESRPELNKAIQQFENDSKGSKSECLFLTYDTNDQLKLTSFPCATDHDITEAQQPTESVSSMMENRTESSPSVQAQQSPDVFVVPDNPDIENQNAITKAKLEKIHRELSEGKTKKTIGICKSPAEYKLTENVSDTNIDRKIVPHSA